MPRVGSSSMTTSGPAMTQRLKMTFCWLPPESSSTLWSTFLHLMRSFSL